MRSKIVLFIIFCVITQIAIAQNKLPLIGVSSSWGDTDTRVPKAYVEAVMMAGGVAVVLPITDNKEMIEQQIDTIDALVVTGGADLNPLLYGEEPNAALGKVYEQRDEYDIALIKMAIKKGKPILAICRGLQVINIIYGGTLYQDIPSTYGKPYIKHDQERDVKLGSHTVTIVKDTQLYKILQSEKVLVNSTHHQAVNKLADGFTVSARTSDGIIEAIESVEKKIIAVQFHPEEMVYGGNKLMLKLFHNLIQRAENK